MASRTHGPAPYREKDRLTVIVFVVICVLWLALTLRPHFDPPASATPAVKGHASNVMRPAATAPLEHR